MAFTYNSDNSISNKKTNNYILACHMLAIIINMFVSTFLVAHIYSFNGDTYSYIYNVSVYNIFIYLAFFITYIPFNYLVDKTNRISLYRIGLIIKAALVIIIIFFGKELSKLLILAGVMNGIAESLYYTSYNIIKEEMVGKQSMTVFMSNTYVISRIIQVVCPILLGLLIDVTTFSQTAFAVLLICIIQVLLSFGIKSQKPVGSHFSLKEFYKKLKDNPEARKKVKIIYIASFIFGTTTMLTTLINVCVMLEYGSNLSLGTVTGIFAFVSIIALFILKNFTNSTNRKWLMIISALITITSSIVFAIIVNSVTLIILNGTITVLSMFYKYPYDVYRNSILKTSGLYSEISEHHTVVECLMNLARILTFAILMAVGLLKNMIIFKIYTVIAVLLSSSLFVIMMIYEKRFVHNN